MLSLVAIMAIFAFTSCNSSTDQSESTIADTTVLEAAVPIEKEVSIIINASDEMKYDLAEIKVKEGQIVKLT